MKLRTSRRTFLGATAAGIAGAALPVSRAAAAPDTAERQRLLELAHFGKKAPAEGAGGMAITSHPLATRAAIDILKPRRERVRRGAGGLDHPDRGRAAHDHHHRLPVPDVLSTRRPARRPTSTAT